MPISKSLLDVLPAPDVERAGYLAADIEAHLEAEKVRTILDMGAGSGSMTAACLDICRSAHATLVDVAARLELDTLIGESKQSQWTGLDWPAHEALKGKEFDLVLSMDVLEHVPDWRQALESLFQYVKPSGYLYVQAPSRYPSPNWPTKAIVINRLKGIWGGNNPATHVRHGLSCKEILDVCVAGGLKPLVASESYVLDGICHCAFKPRTHLLLKREPSS